MNPSFWRNKRVLVTGHTGFKGAWLCLLLNSFGARVRGYALDPPTQPSLYALARVHELVESTIGDVRHLDGIVGTVAAFSPEIVLHMAAQSVVLHSYADPVTTYTTNVAGTVNVLEAVRRMRGPCVVVNVTTDKCYENKAWDWGYRENDALGGHDPYSNSKACAELVGQSYRDSFFPLTGFDDHGVGIASARAGNVIGGGDWTPRQLIPDTIAGFLKAEPIVLRIPVCAAVATRLIASWIPDPSGSDGEGRPGALGRVEFRSTDAESRSVSYVVESLAREWASRGHGSRTPGGTRPRTACCGSMSPRRRIVSDGAAGSLSTTPCAWSPSGTRAITADRTREVCV
jgi:CDP-glucose 4,6-dehydratase